MPIQCVGTPKVRCRNRVGNKVVSCVFLPTPLVPSATLYSTKHTMCAKKCSRVSE